MRSQAVGKLPLLCKAMHMPPPSLPLAAPPSLSRCPAAAEHEIPKSELRALGDPNASGPASAGGRAGREMCILLVMLWAAPHGRRCYESVTPGCSPAVPPSRGLAAPSPAAPPPAAAAGGGAGGGLPAGWEDKVQRLQALGFSREQCLQALRSTNGNEEMAGALLFGG